MGGVLEVTLGTEWPWWLDRASASSRRPDRPSSAAVQRGRESSSPPSPAPVALSLDDLGEDGAAGPRALGPLRQGAERPALPASTERRGHGRALAWRERQHVRRALPPRRLNGYAPFSGQLPARFVDHVLSHAAADERIAVYHLYASDGTSLGAAMLVLFECTLAKEESVALMVDTFAVEVTQQGRGVGGRIFHDFCRRLADRHCPPRATSYYVFAQCVRKGTPDTSGTTSSMPRARADVMLAGLPPRTRRRSERRAVRGEGSAVRADGAPSS